MSCIIFFARKYFRWKSFQIETKKKEELFCLLTTWNISPIVTHSLIKKWMFILLENNFQEELFHSLWRNIKRFMWTFLMKVFKLEVSFKERENFTSEIAAAFYHKSLFRSHYNSINRQQRSNIFIPKKKLTKIWKFSWIHNEHSIARNRQKKTESWE